MDFETLVRKLSAVEDPAGALVTLGLDVSKSGVLPAATRIFLKDEVYRNLASEARPAGVREALLKLSRRIRDYVEKGLKEETDGVFLVAGKGVWEAVELRTALPNFVDVGRTAYLAPLLEAERLNPRAYLVEAGLDGAVVSELHLGERTEKARIASKRLADDVERAVARRSTSRGGGGAERDLQQRRLLESGRAMLRAAALEVGKLHRKAPAEAVFLAANHEPFEEFRGQLPAELRPRAASIGPREKAAPHAERELKRVVEERRRRDEEQLRGARARGLQVALGPRDVLERLATGDVERVYLDPLDSHPGVVCTDCGGRFPELHGRCPKCSGGVRGASLTQEVVAQALARPPLEIAFVRGRTPWLVELGGMAGLLSAKPARRKRSGAGLLSRR